MNKSAMLYNIVLYCCIFTAIFHYVKAQTAVSQDSTDKTIIIIISVTASIIAVAVIVAIVVGCIYFKKSVKKIQKKHMKLIVNSKTLHMLRVEKLETMNEFYNEVEKDEKDLFPEILEEEQATDKDEIGDAQNEEVRIVDQDISDVVEIDDEVSPDLFEEDVREAIASDTEQIDDDTTENDNNFRSTVGKTFFLKKEPSFLKFIVKEHWKIPVISNIPQSRLEVSQDNLKRKHTIANTTKSTMVTRQRSKKKLKKIRPRTHRYDYFMKPMKTKVREYKWNKRKPRSKLVHNQKKSIANVDRKIGTKLMMSLHEED